MALSIDQIPIPVPSSTDPANFSARGDAVFGAFPDFITETNAVASEAAANRDSAEASKIAAANSETNAATYAANATTSANNASSSSVASLWVSGTTYAINDKRVSPITGQVYRRKTDGAGTTDPSSDSTNWYAVLLDADTQYPTIKPTLNLDFANSGKLDPRVTFTRASTATYYDGKTFAKAEENLLTYSQDFDNALWTKSGSAVTANSTTAPDGTTTADSLIEDSATSNHGCQQSTTLTATQHTFSAYVKPNGRSWVQLVMNNVTNGFAYFDVTTGSVGTVGAGATATISSAGGGWYRCSITFTAVAGTSVPIIRIASANGTASYTGDGVSGLFVWGAQLEQRSSVTAYTPTTSQPITKYQPVLKTASNNEPRFDYDPVTLEAKGLLIEESRQNLLNYSQNLGGTGWTNSYAVINLNTVFGVDGTQTGSKLYATVSTATHETYQIGKNLSAGTYTATVYAKAAEYGWLNMSLYDGAHNNCWFNLNNGVVGTIAPGCGASMTSVGNGWYRCSVVKTISATSNGGVSFRPSTSNNTAAFTGDGFSGIYIWGAQLEQGSFPTSYIPTTTTAVTRQADNAVITGTNFSSWYNQSEGTFVATCIAPDVSSDRRIFTASNSTFDGILTSNYRNTNQFFVANSGTQASLTALTYLAGTKVLVAGAYKVNDFSLSVNSSATVADTSGTIPAVDRLFIGSAQNSLAVLSGTISRLTYYPKRLPNYQLQILTK